MRNFW